MEVEAASLMAAQSHTDTKPAVPDKWQVEAFGRALFGVSNGTPEGGAIVEFQDKAAEVSSKLDPLDPDGSVLNNPLDMLARQSDMQKSMVEVDLIAKSAGAISQGINRLVNMQ